MQSPKTDDFRLERGGGSLVVTFTPDGRSYTFPIEEGPVQEGRLSEPTASPAQTNAADYPDDEVRRMATELAKLALTGAP